MEDLKNYRISLKFSEKDSEQAEVAKLLKQLGRKKSAFITKAIKYYLENNPSPEIPGNNNVITSMLTENLVKTTILKMIQSGELTYTGQLQNVINDNKEIPQEKTEEPKKTKPKKVEKVITSPEKKQEEQKEDIKQEDVDYMLEMLEYF